jgi:hypothetical protein
MLAITYRSSFFLIELSPGEPLNSRNRIEMPIAAEDWKVVLPAERRDPRVIHGDGFSDPPQVQPYRCIVMRGFFGDV